MSRATPSMQQEYYGRMSVLQLAKNSGVTPSFVDLLDVCPAVDKQPNTR